MKVFLRGSFKWLDDDTVHRAAAFYLNLIFSDEEMNKSWNMLIKACDSKSDEDFDGSSDAVCEFTNTEEAKVTISIRKACSAKNILLNLAHEIVHAKQFINGELVALDEGMNVWRGILIDENDIDYWDQPWEIDAYGREYGMYRRFKDEEKKNGRGKKPRGLCHPDQSGLQEKGSEVKGKI